MPPIPLYVDGVRWQIHLEKFTNPIEEDLERVREEVHRSKPGWNKRGLAVQGTLVSANGFGVGQGQPELNTACKMH